MALGTTIRGFKTSPAALVEIWMFPKANAALTTMRYVSAPLNIAIVPILTQDGPYSQETTCGSGNKIFVDRIWVPVPASDICPGRIGTPVYQQAGEDQANNEETFH